MSLFKNRIPKNSVSFSHETYELQFPKPPQIVREIEVDQAELLQKQQLMQVEFEQLQHEQLQFQEQYNIFLQEREQFERQKEEEIKRLEQERLQLEEERIQMKKEQQEAAYEWADLLWDQSLKLAENIVNQTVHTRQLHILPILKGIVQTLPTSFEKLVVTVHPDTFECIEQEKESSKEYWLLQLVEWKYDFSLQFGEFVLEEEKEFFEFHFASIFEQLRNKRAEEKMFEEQTV
ncbi:FliH/SctL family protein [Bacillus manliponensis]|uniref:FliH/SctL family protein n=1 Tax=Bacillus manliponensis TaxID=574376 RepID=UPI0035189CA6